MCSKSQFALKIEKSVYSRRKEERKDGKMFTLVVGDISSLWHVKGLQVAELEKLTQELLPVT